MKIRLTCDRAGEGFVERAGDVVDLPADEAKRLLSVKQAEPIEQATRGASENAARRGGGT